MFTLVCEIQHFRNDCYYYYYDIKNLTSNTACAYSMCMILCVCVAVTAILTQTTWNVFKKNWQLREWRRQTWLTGREISFKTQESTLNIHSRISVTISTSQKVQKLMFSFAVHQIRLLISVSAGRLPILCHLIFFSQELSLFVCLCNY